MSQSHFFARISSMVSVLSLSAVLLGSVTPTATWSMDEPELPSRTTKQTPREFLADAQKGDVVFFNLLHGIVKIVEWIKPGEEEKYLESHLVGPYKGFRSFVQQTNPDHDTALNEKRKMATGKEFLKPGIEGLSSLLDELLARKVTVYFLTSSGGENEATWSSAEARSRRDLKAIGLDYEKLGNALPYQNSDERVVLSYGHIDSRRGPVIYAPAGGKGAASKETLDVVEAAQGYKPPHAWFVEKKDTNAKLRLTDFGGSQAHFLDYQTDKAFKTAQDIEQYIIHRLGDDFNTYKSEFETFFLMESR
jgi:hypothetical protein